MMKRICIIILAGLLILLSACRQEELPPTFLDPSTGSTSVSVETTVPTTQPQESTAPSSQPATAPTEPSTFPDPTISATAKAPSILYGPGLKYSQRHDHKYPFMYDGEPPIYAQWIDTEGCELGHLYVYDALTQVRVDLSGAPIIVYTCTKDHIFFITQAEPNRIIRSDYYGTEQRTVYTATYGNISFSEPYGDGWSIEYYGTDENGKLSVLEDNRWALLVDVQTGEAELLLEREGMYDYIYSPEGNAVVYHDARNWHCVYYIDTGETTSEYK